MQTLRAEQLRVRYRAGGLVLDDLSVDLRAGELTALIGSNGSGKSTLLRTLARLHRPEAGRVLLDGTDVTALSARTLARAVSFLPQSPIVPQGISVTELVAFGRHPHQGVLGRTSAGDRDAVDWAIERTGLGELAPRGVESLSGGERQRAFVAMALAQRAELLLLDEPTSYLDLRHQVDLMDLVRDLVDQHGRTVVVVLHDLNQAAAYADRMVMLKDGRIVHDGPPRATLTGDAVREVFDLDSAVLPDPVTGMPACFPYRIRERTTA